MWMCCRAVRLLCFNPEVGGRKAEFIPKKSVDSTEFSLQKRPTTAEGMCFVLPVVVLQEAEGISFLRQQPADQATAVCNNSWQQHDQISNTRKLLYSVLQYQPKRWEHRTCIIHAFRCSKTATNLRDPGLHWSWDVERSPWNGLLKSSKVPPGSICVTSASLANTRSKQC